MIVVVGDIVDCEVRLAHRQQLVVDAQAVPLGVRIRQHARLQHRVVADSNACTPPQPTVRCVTTPAEPSRRSEIHVCAHMCTASSV